MVMSEPGSPAVIVDEGRKFTYSFNIGGTSDYVFRGISQSSNDPVLQGGADFGYGIFYGGVWASGVDFDNAPPANAEVDWYGGIRPTWKSPLGDMNLDFGAIYYSYPGADPSSVGITDPNYWELKAGYSWSVLHPSLTTGTTVFWSPDYFAETGSVWTIETSAAWTLPKVAFFSPVSTASSAGRRAIEKDGYFVNVNGTTTSTTTGTPASRSASTTSPSISVIGTPTSAGCGQHLRRGQPLRSEVRLRGQGHRSLRRADSLMT